MILDLAFWAETQEEAAAKALAWADSEPRVEGVAVEWAVEHPERRYWWTVTVSIEWVAEPLTLGLIA